MATYAALVSLRHIIEQIQHHPRPPISLHKKQVESLTEKVTFLQDFLESYSINGGSKDADHNLESRIADAAHAAEDIIESHIVDQIQAGSTSTHVENISEFYQDLQEVIQDMDLIEREVMEIKEKVGIQDQLQRISISAGSLRSPPMVQNMTMVGFDDVLIEIMDKLTGQQSNRQIIPIVGMGGIADWRRKACHPENVKGKINSGKELASNSRITSKKGKVPLEPQIANMGTQGIFQHMDMPGPNDYPPLYPRFLTTLLKGGEMSKRSVEMLGEMLEEQS